VRLPILLVAAAAIALPAMAHAKEADDRLPLPIVTAPSTTPAQTTASGIPAQLGDDQRAGYRLVFAAIHERRWSDAQAQLEAMPQGALHAIARAEIFTGKGSPKVEADPLRALLLSNPELPQAEQIARMARTRGLGDGDLPVLPTAQKLVWLGSTQSRGVTGRVLPLMARTERSVLTPTTSMSPRSRACRRYRRWPGWRMSNTPLVNTIRPPPALTPSIRLAASSIENVGILKRSAGLSGPRRMQA